MFSTAVIAAAAGQKGARRSLTKRPRPARCPCTSSLTGPLSSAEETEVRRAGEQGCPNGRVGSWGPVLARSGTKAARTVEGTNQGGLPAARQRVERGLSSPGLTNLAWHSSRPNWRPFSIRMSGSAIMSVAAASKSRPFICRPVYLQVLVQEIICEIMLANDQS